MTTHLERPPNRFGRTYTLGLMLESLADLYQGGLATGALDVTRAAGVNLLCFVGDQLTTNPNEQGRNRVFELISGNVDGLILLSSPLMHKVGRTGLVQYCQNHFDDLPVYSIGVNLDAVPSLVPDSRSGILGIIDHLVRVHGHKRIAFVRGPQANDEAQCRFDAYLEALELNGLACDERLIAPGDFMPTSGREAVQRFSKIRGMLLTDLDAIVASNDGMAIGVLHALEEAGIAVAEQVAVTGFDDAEEAGLTTPQLTTVRQPFAKIGQQAARNVVEWMQTGTRPGLTEVPAEVVVRRSCGCTTGTVKRINPGTVENTTRGFNATLVMLRQQILDKVTRAAKGQFGPAGPDWQARLLSAFSAEVRGEEPQAMQQLIEDFAEKLAACRTDVQICHDITDCLRDELIACFNNEPERRNQVEDIFYRAHLTIGEVLRRGLMRSRLQLGRWVTETSRACNYLSAVDDLDELCNSINVYLPQLGIGDYSIVVYRNRDPRQANLMLSRDHGQLLASDPSETFDASALLPERVRARILDARAFAVMPLAHKAHLFGHALFGLEVERLFAYDELAHAIGTGLRSLALAGDAG